LHLEPKVGRFVAVYLVNGIKLTGTLAGFGEDVIVLSIHQARRR
jgi:sRNA-binding regulator protein Hfq